MTISRSEAEGAAAPAEPDTAAPAEPDAALFYERDGKTFWRCLRCGGEHGGMDPGQHVKVGPIVVGIACNGCAPVICREIAALIPERSFHGQHVD